MMVFFCVLFKISMAHTPVIKSYWIIRNVGQGLWVTRVENSRCIHYDFGGERIKLIQLTRRFRADCQFKKNILNLSHPDYDHYSFKNMIVSQSKNVCWNTLPHGGFFLKGSTPFCDKENSHVLFYTKAEKAKNNNSVVMHHFPFLLPGDSTIKMEKSWARTKKFQSSNYKYLILGHHGSLTSTGNFLISRLKPIKLAIASSRYLKYKHPHPSLVQRLKKNKIPLISTEDWGNLVFID